MTSHDADNRDPTTEQEELDQSLVRSIAWTGAARWISQIITWTITLAVARILTPDDYGLVGMAVVFYGLVTLINDFGLSTSVVVVRELDRRQIAQINGLAVIVGVTCFVIGCALAYPIAAFFEADELPAIIVVMSSSFLITAFCGVPQGRLEKDLEFKRIALINAVAAVATAVSTLTMALAGLGYWALVLGNVVTALVTTALIVASRPTRFAWPRLATITEATSISVHVTLGRISWFIWSNADYVIAGKLLGKTALGFYSFAFMLASVPVDKISAVVTKVTTAFMSAVQDDHPALRRYLLGLTEGLAFVAFPLTWGLALVAGDFVPLVLGEKWLGLVAPLQILAFYSAVRSVTPVLAPVLNVTGQTRFGMRMSMVFAVILPVGFYVGSHWGVVGIASAWVVFDPFLMLSFLLRVRRTIGLSVRAYLRAWWPAVCSSLLMSAVILMIGLLPLTQEHPVLGLIIKIGVGAATYALSIWLLFRDRLDVAIEALKRLRG